MMTEVITTSVLILVTLGLLFNLTNILVLVRPELRSAVTPILITLACFDMGFLFVSTVGTLTVYSTSGSGDIILVSFQFMEIFAQAGSIYLTVGITAERFLVIFFPLRSRSLCTRKRSLLACLILIGLALLLSLPHLLYWYMVTAGKAGEDFLTWFFFTYEAYGRALIQCVVPFILIATLNFLIYVKILEGRKKRAEMTQQAESGSQGALTAMLLTVVFVFGLCYVPSFVKSFLEMRLMADDASIETMRRLNPIIDDLGVWEYVLVRINATSNFLIYCLLGSTFRNTFGKMLLEFKSNLSGTHQGSRGTESVRGRSTPTSAV